ncbi:hypothetical protein TRFO_23874 [Tritrichomonas foetus]|uniref:Leucine Rich Repeat family protein n=1 Tax=Tritrichomonas foetus TaxID=1144522 RepID=A0A1J4KDH6_9EUKA|nr:hypothetical protein TRFO_23874 [Tritrichomonas foetus]|eukprot:OHT07772.1 hypothetical protein TRFO_23874 [Tritrichomonas foetus]
MNELLDKADSYLHQHKISFTRLFVISNLNDKSKETNHVLVISGSNLLILSKRLASNNLTEYYSFSFFNLTAILLSIENTMILRFASKEIKFQIENPQELVNTILDHIHRILTPHEFSKISYIKPTISLPQPTSHSILFRLNTQLNMHKVEINEKNLKSFTNRFFTHSNSISLNKFKSMDKFLPLFFPCLSMSPFINELEIDTSSIPNIFSIMLQQIESFDRISHIKISSTENEEILKFIKRAKNVNSISFQNCKIKDITNLNSLIQRKYITSIGFDSSIDIETLHMLLNLSSFEKLKYFRVSHLKIDFGFCIQKFKHLYQISLTYCNLMVGNVLDLISSNNLHNLRKIDLSGNIGNGFTNPDPKLPANLSTIFVDDIEWKSSQLLYFFEICSDRISNLSMNKTKCDNWNEFYENLSNQMNLLKSLKTLSWNENQFHESFVNYIKVLPKLKELSVCKCSDINSIINIAIGNKIQSLNIKEMKTENIKSFIERIPDMKSLKQIDISFNSIDDESFTLLADSVFNSEIEFISFDGSKISSHNSLIYFAKKLATRELPLKISYPLNDFGRFKLTKLELSDLIALFDNLRRSLSKRSSVSRKYIPDINFLELDQKFPQFMTHKDISQAERRKHSHHVSDDETPPQNYHYMKRYHQTMPNLHDGLTPQEKTSKKENH